MAYSIVALQELTLNYKFNPLYWQTACLSVNAGGQENDEDESKTKSTEYGKIAAAIGQMKARGINVSLPDINKAGFGFTPDVENNSIIFGLKGMNGIGDDVVHLIIEHRPYDSFQDFLLRMFDTKLVKKSQLIQLIKGGCFDSFDDRKTIMKQFATHLFEPKDKLTMANLKMLIELDMVPDMFSLNVRFFKYKTYISKSVYKTISKPKDKLFLLDEISTQFFIQHFSEECIVDQKDGKLIISEKRFKKEYDKKMEPIKEWLSDSNTLKQINDQLLEQECAEMLRGSLSQWEMETLSYYYNEHELANVNKEKYGIKNFYDLTKEPKVVETYVSRGIQREKYELTRIAGTVLDKDKNKYTVTLLTTDGVVTVKLYAGAFGYYNKQISQKDNKGKKTVLEKSWFTKGNKLLITGFRRGNHFIPRTYKNSVYNHTIMLIEDMDNQGNLYLKSGREQKN